MARRLAEAGILDGIGDPALARLANCGSHGKHEANVERDFHRAFASEAGVQLEPQQMSLPMLDWRTKQQQDTPMWVLAPTEIIAGIHGGALGVPAHSRRSHT